MPRRCFRDHVLSPHSCRVCYWCADRSETGAFHRRLWGEPEPEHRPGNGFASPILRAAPEIVPGLPDPIPDPELRPVPEGWACRANVAARHREALLGLAQADLPDTGPRRGSGLLLTGGGKYWPGIVVAVKMLRGAGSSLPVQIWHRGDQESVRPADLAGIPGVEIHDLTALSPIPRVLRGWEGKTLAMLACGWERILYLDADAYCVSDPAPLLDCLSPEEPFLFWSDLPGCKAAVDWPVWGIKDSHVPAIQGGQLALHTRYFWRELVMAHWLNQHSDFSYSHQYGDQDSWRVALTVTGGPSGCLGPARWDDIAFVCETDGQPYVIHRCRSKMFYPEDVSLRDYESNRRLARLPGEARAWTHYDALMSSRPAAEVFGKVYARGLWGKPGSSGPGSNLPDAVPYLDLINGLVKVSGWRRVIDLGCGDGRVASMLNAPEVAGVDCHVPHVERLRKEMPGREWLSLDIDRDRESLPAGDVALLKDVLHHWPNKLVRGWLEWARNCGKWRWVICTQDHSQQTNGQDCLLGGFRGLNPAMMPLKDLGLIPLCQYAHKSVLLLPELNGSPALPSTRRS